jgi:hypothetical protein
LPKSTAKKLKKKKKPKAKVVNTKQQTDALDALATVALSNKYTRRMLVEKSVKFFAQYYFGITLTRHQVRWVAKLLNIKKGMVLAPCGHGKTEVFSKILILWLICRNRNIRILLTSKSDGLAVKNLKAVRTELESNQKLINDFGRFYDPGATWSDHQLYCIRSKNMKDPTLEAVGLLGAITGGRFDVIVLDDVLDVLNTRSEEQRDKIKDYIDGTLITRLEPWGVCWGIGTRKHYDDYYARKLKDKAWVVIVDQAIIREPQSFEVIETEDPVTLVDSFGNEHETYFRVVITSEDRGECLWPEKWTMENLLLLRYTIGTLVFNREYQNLISSDETALFKIQWLEQCRDWDLSYVDGDFHDRDDRLPYFAIVQGTDPSLVDEKKKAESGDTDYMVTISLGVEKDGTETLLGMSRDRGLSPAQVLSKIEKEYNRFDPEYHFLEANSFGTIHAHSLINDKGLRITKHFTERRKSDPYIGVPSLAVKFENKKFRLPYKTPADQVKTDRLIVEFHGLTIEKHDDIVMAMWIASCGVDRVRSGMKRMRRNVNRVRKAVRA